MSGGVSNDVLLVEAGGVRVVVKQCLAQLRVAADWRATPRRILAEAAALRVASMAVPGACPRVLMEDESQLTIAIEAAPPSWEDWKQQLLRGAVDADVACWLGATLSAWHQLSPHDDLVRQFHDREAFVQLRIDAYYRAAAEAVPEAAPDLRALIDATMETRSALVHGDFSPKNVLVGPTGRWVIDWEVVHVGDPAFDVAFMLTHLHLKAIHRPSSAHAYRQAAQAFLDSYAERSPTPLDAARVRRHVGALLIARVAGKSPAEYLDDEERAVALGLGLSALRDPGELEEIWEMSRPQA